MASGTVSRSINATDPTNASPSKAETNTEANSFSGAELNDEAKLRIARPSP
jgi:hypothetical protein